MSLSVKLFSLQLEQKPKFVAAITYVAAFFLPISGAELKHLYDPPK